MSALAVATALTGLVLALVCTALTWGALALTRTTPTQRSLSCENH